jgi:hypothetical protein
MTRLTRSSESRWVLRAIFFLAFGVGYALNFVPGARDVGQFQDFDLEDFQGVLQTTLGVVLIVVLLIGAAFGARGLWQIAFVLVAFRTLYNFWVALDDPGAALGWASLGASIILTLALGALRPQPRIERRSTEMAEASSLSEP